MDYIVTRSDSDDGNSLKHYDRKGMEWHKHKFGLDNEQNRLERRPNYMRRNNTVRRRRNRVTNTRTYYTMNRQKAARMSIREAYGVAITNISNQIMEVGQEVFRAVSSYIQEHYLTNPYTKG